MVRHILKRDWILLWPIVTAVAVLQVLLAFARFSMGRDFGRGVPTTPAAFLELLAVAIVIMLVVHQDPIPGIRVGGVACARDRLSADGTLRQARCDPSHTP